MNETIKTGDYILIILLITLVCVLFYGVYLIKKEGTKCILAPVPYGIEKLEDAYKIKIDCFCSDDIFINSTGIMKKVTFNIPRNKYNFSMAG